MSTPSSKIYLCRGVRLTNRYDHTLYFATKEEQDDFFNKKVMTTLTAYSYVRKTWKLKVALPFANVAAVSYLFFTNTDDGKKYYYFVNNVEYVNDQTTALDLELDVIQTYLFDMKLLPCYVEREHSESDEIGANTIEEGLEIGEYIINNRDTVNLTSDPRIMIAATIDINEAYIRENDLAILGARYCNTFGAFEITATKLSDSNKLASMLYTLNARGKIDTIFNMWQYPGELLTTSKRDFADGLFAEYVTGQNNDFTHVTTARPSNLNGYVPKNKKLFQYPYCYIYATNNNGGSAVYRYELFTNPDAPTFNVRGSFLPPACVKLTPKDYRSAEYNHEEGLMLDNFPVCSWNSDSYKLWLAQNQNAQNMGFAMAGVKIAGGLATTLLTGGVAAGVGVGTAASGAMDIANQLAQRADKDIQPPQARGTVSGSYNYANNLSTFCFYHRTIDSYHARMIDDFFTMYGYATRTVKVPNISSRPRWNYVKTVGSNVYGNFAQEDITKINSIFDHGVTFWKAHSTMGEYSGDNSPTT